MRKLLRILFILFMILISVMIQVNIFNRVYILGVKCNLLLILTTGISLWYGMFVGGMYGLINGFICDSLYEQAYGKYLLIYAFLGILIGSVNHIYKRENKVTLMYVVLVTTSIFELIDMIINIVVARNFPGVFTAVKIFAISSGLNFILSGFIYYAIVYISYKLDEVLVIEDRW